MFADEETETDVDGLNVIMGAAIPIHKEFKDEIRQKRYDFLAVEGPLSLLGRDASWYKWLCGQCAETFRARAA